MTANTPAEKYTAGLVERLVSLYGVYTKELQIMGRGLKDSTVQVLENFIDIEHHRFRKISSVEKVLNTHLEGCGEDYRDEVFSRLDPLRREALSGCRSVRSALKDHMNHLRTELSSLRRTGRAKNYKQESVPVLIDIER